MREAGWDRNHVPETYARTYLGKRAEKRGQAYPPNILDAIIHSLTRSPFEEGSRPVAQLFDLTPDENKHVRYEVSCTRQAYRKRPRWGGL